MWLDLRSVVQAPDRRPVSPATLKDRLSLKTDADADALADDVADWWTENLRHELWANTWVARVPGQGIQWILSPRWPIWDDPPVVTPFDEEFERQKYDPVTYRVTGQCRQLLYRQVGWPWTAPLVGIFTSRGASGIEDPLLRIGPDPDDPSVLGYRAGFVMPGEILTWANDTEWAPKASTSYGGSAYGFAKATDRTVVGLFEVAAGSGTVGTEPTWPTVDGESVTESGVTFTLRLFAQELPRVYVTASIELARALQAAAAGGSCPDDKAVDIMKMVSKAC